ncbi:hypothetical protein PanWU01x14_264930, partial [Parasponia andersonii]
QTWPSFTLRTTQLTPLRPQNPSFHPPCLLKPLSIFFHASSPIKEK